MIENLEKTQRILEGVNKFWLHNRRGTYNYPFQFGKTYAAKLTIDMYLHRNPKAKIRIIVPSKPLVAQWTMFLQQYQEYTNVFLKDNIVIRNAHSVITDIVKEDCDLLVLDEIHRFTTFVHYGILEGSYYNYQDVLGLTGAFPIKEEGKMISQYCPVIDTVHYDYAMSKGWISGITEYNLALTLSADDKYRYAKLSEPIADIMQDFRGAAKLFQLDGKQVFKNDMMLIYALYGGANINVSDTEKVWVQNYQLREELARVMGWYPRLNLDNELNNNIENAWNPSTIEMRVKQFASFIDKRTALITENDIKLKATLELFEQFTVPTLCFSESIAFADKVQYVINSNIFVDNMYNVAEVYHSNLKSKPRINPETGDYYRFGPTAKNPNAPKNIGSDRLKSMIIDDLNDGRCMFISAVKSLKEGINVPNLGMILATSGDSNPITYLEMTGRGMSINDNDENKHVKVINLYFDDFDIDGKHVNSRDKQKLIMRQMLSENNIQWIEKKDEIK